MRVGDIRMETPSFWTTYGHGLGRPQRCRVVYIHPLRRFYVVEFRSELTGLTFRQSCYFAGRRGSGDEKGQNDEIDSNHE